MCNVHLRVECNCYAYIKSRIVQRLLLFNISLLNSVRQIRVSFSAKFNASLTAWNQKRFDGLIEMFLVDGLASSTRPTSA